MGLLTRLEADIPTPQDLGLPHDEWRPAQRDLFLKARQAYKDGKQFVFGEAPTGVGKTAAGTALANIAPVLYVAGTLALLDQAEREYGFSVIKGRQEYPCVLPKKVELWAKDNKIPTARDCHFSKMEACPSAGDCPYIIAKHRALNARKMACTYKYLMLSGRAQERKGIVILDEVHESVEQVMSFSEFSIDEWTRRDWGLPEFPYKQRYGPNGKGDILSLDAREKVERWLDDARDALQGYDKESERGAKAKRLQDRIGRMAEDLPGVNWFLQCGYGVIDRVTKGKLHKLPGIVLRALDARPVAKRLWNNKQTALLMSATIGDPKALAGGLGIDEFESVSYDHPVPWEYRPVFDLGLPRMTHSALKANPSLLDFQGIRIANEIEKLNPSWRIVVLAPSNYKVKRLRNVLSARLDGRVFMPPDSRSANRLAAFKENDAPGLILVDTVQGFGHGVDFYGDEARVMVLAGIEFPNPSDPFMQARRKIAGADKYLWQHSYNQIPQACGRVSRGEKDENDKWLTNIAMLADGSLTTGRAKKSYPSWFEVRKE